MLTGLSQRGCPPGEQAGSGDTLASGWCGCGDRRPFRPHWSTIGLQMLLLLLLLLLVLLLPRAGRMHSSSSKLTRRVTAVRSDPLSAGGHGADFTRGTTGQGGWQGTPPAMTFAIGLYADG